MNDAAFLKTRNEGLVTFFSRSRNELWTKGATSGNYLHVKDISLDCDSDALLIKVAPDGPVCHNGTTSCFGDASAKGFLYQLETIIAARIDGDDISSYTLQLYRKGLNKVAQKVGEEAVEVVIEAKDSNEELFKNEVADLLFHLFILLKAKGATLGDIEDILLRRHHKS
jgi:phosphoribosyl-ATP pyrophosphohydrolase/phosphoribosyl-AMP cyclohydrolase